MIKKDFSEKQNISRKFSRIKHADNVDEGEIINGFR